MTTEARATQGTKATDVFGLSFSALWQQKVRTILTITGVVIGTFALVLSLSVGRGVDHAIVSLFHEDGRLRRIMVNEKYDQTAEDVPAEAREPKGTMSEAKRKRISKALVREWGRTHVRKQRNPLNPTALNTLSAIEHVERVEPVVWFDGELALNGKSEKSQAMSVPLRSSYLRKLLLAGRLFTTGDRRAAIVHEFLLYRMGLTGDEAAAQALGQTIRFEYDVGRYEQVDLLRMMSFGPKALSEKEAQTLKSAIKRLAVLVRLLPMPAEERAALGRVFDRLTTTATAKGRTYAEELTIVGVVREQTEEDEKPGPFGNWLPLDADILLPSAFAGEYYFRAPEHVEAGASSVVVTVDQEDHVKDVEKRIGTLGFNVWSLVQFIETVHLNVMMITFATAFVAIVALIVAAVGITNTMIMSVLERSHEIGVMKALGARERHILLIFLIEGTVIGVAGSLIGLALAWLASIPGDSIARSIMEPQTQWTVKETLFLFPLWLVAGVPALVSLITTLAAFYPARRAARVDPVTSLRHE
jgi:putative ABC transport system permease protein